MENFRKVIHPYNMKDAWRKNAYPVFMKIELEKGKLSITGVEGPLPSGNCKGGCGQINMNFDYHCIDSYAKEWDVKTLSKLFEIWEKYHLNDLHAGCEHQRALGWEDILLDPGQPKTQKNMASWTYPKDHPGGVLAKPCPICGYEFGTKWLKEEIPVDVLEWLKGLPNTDKTPAWV